MLLFGTNNEFCSDKYMNRLDKQNNKLQENIEHYSTEGRRRFLGHNVDRTSICNCKMPVNGCLIIYASDVYKLGINLKRSCLSIKRC